MTSHSVPQAVDPLSILEAVDAPVVMLDERCRLLFANRAFRDLADPSGTLAGRLADAVRSALAAGDDHAETDSLAGKPALSWRMRPVHGQPGAIVATGHHVSDERHRAAADAERIRALEDANAELERFAMMAAHDLNVPFRRMAAFAAILGGENPAVPDRAAHAIEGMREAARRAGATIRAILSLARADRAPVRLTVELADLVRVVTADVLAGHPDLPVEIEDRLVTHKVPADADSVRLLVQNLLVNAVEHRDRGRPLRIRLGLEVVEGVAILSVEDNGTGFSPAGAASLLARSARPGAGTRGTGLGLAIAARVADRHGWRIEADGRPGQGATFRVVMGAP